MIRFAAYATFAGAALASLAAQAAPTGAQPATAAPQASGGATAQAATPAAQPTPAAAATPTAAATPAAPQTGPAPTPPPALPTPAYNFVYRATPAPAPAPPGAPGIQEIDLSDATIVTPGAIHVRVLTSSAVTSVVAQTFGRAIAIPQRASGLFALDATVSAVPAFLKGRSYAIDFVATVPDGRTANVTLPLVLK